MLAGWYHAIAFVCNGAARAARDVAGAAAEGAVTDDDAGVESPLSRRGRRDLLDAGLRHATSASTFVDCGRRLVHDAPRPRAAPSAAHRRGPCRRRCRRSPTTRAGGAAMSLLPTRRGTGHGRVQDPPAAAGSRHAPRMPRRGAEARRPLHRRRSDGPSRSTAMRAQPVAKLIGDDGAGRRARMSARQRRLLQCPRYRPSRGSMRFIGRRAASSRRARCRTPRCT